MNSASRMPTSSQFRSRESLWIAICRDQFPLPYVHATILGLVLFYLIITILILNIASLLTFSRTTAKNKAQLVSKVCRNTCMFAVSVLRGVWTSQKMSKVRSRKARINKSIYRASIKQVFVIIDRINGLF